MPISSTQQLELLRRMKLIRCVEESIAERYPKGEMRCPTHLSTGQEAVPAAFGLLTRQDDFAVSTHRAHGHYIGKGGDIGRMLAELYGRETGCSGGKGGSMHLIDESVGFMGSTAIVGNTIPIGVGLALSIQLKKSDQISCVFLGDGAVEEGVFYESVNFAALRNLPVLFLCENNLYSVYSSLAIRQPKDRAIFKMVEGLGIQAEVGNGNDPMEVWDRLVKAIDSIRSGCGPIFLEFETYRWREHCGPHYDDELGYRPDGELAEWKKRDPILTFENKLMEEKLMSQDAIDAMNEETLVCVEDAFKYAIQSPYPGPEQVSTHIYK